MYLVIKLDGASDLSSLRRNHMPSDLSTLQTTWHDMQWSQVSIHRTMIWWLAFHTMAWHSIARWATMAGPCHHHHHHHHHHYRRRSLIRPRWINQRVNESTRWCISYLDLTMRHSIPYLYMSASCSGACPTPYAMHTPQTRMHYICIQLRRMQFLAHSTAGLCNALRSNCVHYTAM